MKVTTTNVFKNSEGTYLSHSCMNGLFYSENIEAKKLEVIGRFANPSCDNAWYIVSTIQYNNDIYFFSCYAPEAWRLNEDNQLEKMIYSNEKTVELKAVIKYKNYAWVFPTYFSQNIIRINLDTWKSEKIEWNIEKYLGIDEQSFSEIVMINNKVYFTNRIPNRIVMFEMDLETIEVRDRSLSKFNCIQSIMAEENTFWVLGRKKDGCIVLAHISYKDEVLKEFVFENEISIIPENETMFIYPHIIKVDNKIILPPYRGSKMVIVDIEKEKVISLDDEVFEDIYSYYVEGEKVFLFSEKHPRIIIYNVTKNEYKKNDLRILNEEKISILCNSVIKESLYVNITDMIKELCMDKKGRENDEIK